MQRKQAKGFFLAFIAGLVSTLFFSTPMGRVSMLDFVTLLVGPIALILIYRRLPRKVLPVLWLSLLWLVTAIISDLWRETPIEYAFKQWIIIFNSLTILATAFWFLVHNPRVIVPFMIGNAISNVVSLYYFQNGAMLFFAMQAGYFGSGGIGEYLLDKQVYPLYASLFICAIVWPLRMIKAIPWFVCGLCFLGGGLYLLWQGGSRSNFLFYTIASGLTFLYAYAPRFLMKMLEAKKIVIVGVFALAIVMNWVLHTLQSSGALGKEVQDDYYRNLELPENSFLDDRSDIIVNWPFLWRSPIIGAGSLYIDRWGYAEQSGLVRFSHDQIPHFLGHSCLVGSWTSNGIGGLLFWGFALFLLLDFLGRKLFAFGAHVPFVLFILLKFAWNILFSPYGSFRGLAMFIIALLALLRDESFVRRVAEYFDRKNMCGYLTRQGGV